MHANFDVTGTFNNHTFVNSGQLDSDIFGVGVLGGYPADGSGATKVYNTYIDFDITPSALQAAEQNLLIGYMNPVITGDISTDPNFQVTLNMRREGGVIFSQTFTNATELMNYFNGVTHDMGRLIPALLAEIWISVLIWMSGQVFQALVLPWIPSSATRP